MGSLFIVILHEAAFERVHEAVSAEIIIGRDRDCAICLPDPRVSRRHAVIRQTTSQFVVNDLGSRNGTYLFDHPVNGETPLCHGTEIRIGPYRLKAMFSRVAALHETLTFDESTRTEHAPSSENQTFEQGLSRLTPKQSLVFDLLLDGLQEKEVATRMGISGNTVHEHVKAIYKTLCVSTRAELISRGVIARGQH